MQSISVKKVLILAGIVTLKVLLPWEVRADTQNSINEAKPTDTTVTPVPPVAAVDTVKTSSGFLAEHPETDFTALPGVAYFVMKPALTCTLSTAVGAAGKEILIIPVYTPSSIFVLRDGIAFHTTGGEHIFSFRRASEKWMKYTVGSGVERRFISDGKNLYLIHARY